MAYANMTVCIMHTYFNSQRFLSIVPIFNIPKNFSMLHNTLDTHQWYRICTREITDSHNITICNDKTVNMVQLPQIETHEASAIERFVRLSTTNRQTNTDQPSNDQPITTIHNNNEYNTSPNSILLPHNQFNIILHQFSIMAEELKTFTKQVSSNITKMMQAHNTMQEHTGKLIEKAVS